MKIFRMTLAMLMLIPTLVLASVSPVNKGDTLIYRSQIDNQGVEVANAEAFKDTGEKVGVNRSISHLSEKVLSADDGLIDGHQPKVGLKYDSGFSHTDDSGKDVPYYCYVEKKETITVPAGTFEDCFKIVSERNTETETSWYYPGVGIVKYTYHHHSGTVVDEIKELEKIVRA